MPKSDIFYLSLELSFFGFDYVIKFGLSILGEGEHMGKAADFASHLVGTLFVLLKNAADNPALDLRNMWFASVRIFFSSVVFDIGQVFNEAHLNFFSVVDFDL